MDLASWKELEPAEQAIWDTMSDKAKATILGSAEKRATATMEARIATQAANQAATHHGDTSMRLVNQILGSINSTDLPSAPSHAPSPASGTSTTPDPVKDAHPANTL